MLKIQRLININSGYLDRNYLLLTFSYIYMKMLLVVNTEIIHDEYKGRWAANNPFALFYVSRRKT